MLTVSFFCTSPVKGKNKAGELPFSRRYNIGDVKNELGVYILYFITSAKKMIHKKQSLLFNKLMQNANGIGRAGNIASELLFPRRCPICTEPMLFGQKGGLGAHPQCYARLHRICSPFCMKCGKQLQDPQSEYCPDCRRTERSFVCSRGLWRYDSVSKQAVFSLKYRRQPEHAAFFAENLCRFYGGWIRSIRPDCIVPVPVSRERLRERGYNQAELIAVQLGKRLQIPVRGDVLVRSRSTNPQKELSRLQRMRNLEQAFGADPDLIIKNGRYLLLDDVYTTGATAECCSKALLRAGAGRVWCLAVCSGEQ